MAEISKAYKIALLLMAGIALGYAVMWLFFMDAFYAITGSPYEDPVVARSAGMTLLALAVFNILAVKRAEGENIRFYLEFTIFWLILSTISLIITLFDPLLTSNPTYMRTFWIAMVVFVGCTVLDIYFYLKEIK